MNFLKNSVSTIGNAVEINNLKSKREELNKQKKELELLCNKYDDQVELKNNILKITQTNLEIISNLRTLFAKSNTKYDIEFDEFTNLNTDPDLIMYKKLYDQLCNSSKTVEETSNQLDKNISVKREIYTDKIDKLNGQIEVVNNKLKSVRDKQFK